MHEGHRKRLYDKFINGDYLSETEIIELALCFVIPHKDVKPIAARLIECYGSAKAVLSAPPETLINVNGVGKQTVAFFTYMRRFAKYMQGDIHKESLCSVYETVGYFKEHFKKLDSEQFVVALLDRSGDIVSKLTYSDSDVREVSVGLTDIAMELANSSVVAAVIAHNHFSGNVMPSAADDATTKKLAFMFNVHGVSLYDHLIFCGDEYFSYHNSGRMDKIKEIIKDTVM